MTVDSSYFIKSMINAGNYEDDYSNVTQNRSVPEGQGVSQVDVTLVRLNAAVPTAAVVGELESLMLKPAKIEVLLAVGAQHPELQRAFPIACLGSVWTHGSGDRIVTCLTAHGRKRYLFDRPFEQEWPRKYRFLGVDLQSPWGCNPLAEQTWVGRPAYDEVPRLTEALRSSNETTRTSAAIALGKIASGAENDHPEVTEYIAAWLLNAFANEARRGFLGVSIRSCGN